MVRRYIEERSGSDLEKRWSEFAQLLLATLAEWIAVDF